MNKRISKYNFFIKDKGKYYIYNTLHSNLRQISKSDYVKLKNNNTQNITTAFTKNGFAYNARNNELDSIYNKFISERESGETLILTIAISLKCNFACPYCYENRNDSVMTDDNINILFSFIEKKLHSRKFKNLSITWFGGEPLLFLEKIIRLNTLIDQLCHKLKINKKAFMSTNGYLVSLQNINKIKSLNLTLCYVTIDGPKNIHNKTRILTNGQGTFDVIINSLKIMKEHNIPYSIRINVDKKNKNNALKLNRYFKNNKICYESMFLGHIQKFTNSCDIDQKNCLSKNNFASAYIKYIKKSKQEIMLPMARWIHCRALSHNNYVIDSELNIFQCENDLGNNDLSVGKIENNCIIKRKTKNDYFLWNPFKFEKCVDCSFLPLCLGGCPYVGLKDNKPQCRMEKYNLNQILSIYIRQNKYSIQKINVYKDIIIS